MNVLSRLFVATTAALCLAGPSLQAQGVPQHLQPRLEWGGLNQKVNQFKNHAQDVQDQGALLTALSEAYLSVMQGFHPDAALATVGEVYADAFGQTFVVGTHGLEAWGPPGALDPDVYTTVTSVPDALAAALVDLEMYEIDLTQAGLPVIPYPVGWPNPVEAYFYAATFGSSEPHVGLALRFEQAASSQLGFVPMVQVPDGGLISASDAGAFLGMLAVDGFATTSFADWALAHYLAATWDGEPGAKLFPLPGTTYAQEVDVRLTCGNEALAKCLDAAAAAANAAIDAEAQRHQDRLDQIAAVFAAGKGWDLAAWTAAGAVPGAIGGTAAFPGVGSAAGAALGALVGAAGGAIGWLFSTAGDAESAQEDIDEENDLHHANICSIASDFGSDVMDCFNEHCPELADFAAGLVADMLASLGC